MLEIIAKSLATTLPPFLQQAFLDDVTGALTDDARASLPSACIIRRCELSLDAALMLVQRDRVASAGLAAGKPSVVRFGWADSSPIAGFDWIWSEYHEISRDRLVETFEAAVSLANATSTFARETAAGGRGRGDINDGDVEVGREIRDGSDGVLDVFARADIWTCAGIFACSLN